MTPNTETALHLKNSVPLTFSQRQECIVTLLQHVEWTLTKMTTAHGNVMDEHVAASIERIQRELSDVLTLQHAIWDYTKP